jgi:hypothetical protein
VAGSLSQGQLIVACILFVVLSLVQFAAFPDLFFGWLARRTRERAFRRRLRRIGLSEYENVNIDWTTKSIVFDY